MSRVSNGHSPREAYERGLQAGREVAREVYRVVNTLEKVILNDDGQEESSTLSKVQYTLDKDKK